MKRKLNFRDTVTVKREMGDRSFPNEMPDYIPETTTTAVDETVTERNNKDSLTNLLSLPYNILSQRLKASALDVKDTVKFPLSLNSILLTSGFHLFLTFRHTPSCYSSFFNVKY